METIVSKIIDLVWQVKEGKIDKNDLNRDSSLIIDAGLDSLQLINFILLVEDEYNIEIDFDSFDYKLLEKIESFCEFIKIQIKKD